MKSKKSEGLTMNTVVIAVLVMIVLAVMIFIIYKFIVKGTNDTLDPIADATKIKTCCATMCMGAPPGAGCERVKIDTDCNNCQLATPGSGQPATS